MEVILQTGKNEEPVKLLLEDDRRCEMWDVHTRLGIPKFFQIVDAKWAASKCYVKKNNNLDSGIGILNTIYFWLLSYFKVKRTLCNGKERRGHNFQWQQTSFQISMCLLTLIKINSSTLKINFFYSPHSLNRVPDILILLSGFYLRWTLRGGSLTGWEVAY